MQLGGKTVIAMRHLENLAVEIIEVVEMHRGEEKGFRGQFEQA